MSEVIGIDEALRCDPLPHQFSEDITAPNEPRQASDVVWASISNSAAWPCSHTFEDALEIGRNVIAALYAAGFALVGVESEGRKTA